MQVNITARHLDLTPALSNYVQRKVRKAQRYFDSIIWAHTTLVVEKHRHIAEVTVHTPGRTFRTKGEAGDLYSAIDLAAHKLDLHLSRVKDKKRDHRKNHFKKTQATPPEFQQPDNLSSVSSGPVTEVSKLLLETRSLTNAIKELNNSKLPFLLFINERSNQISAVYKKQKDSYGLIEAEV